ncbi:unnamed protein product, partial [Allacma fusca]
VGILKY